MTTYTLAGHSLYNAGSSLLSTGPSTLSFFVPEGGVTTASYTVSNSGLPKIATTSLSNGFLMLDNEPFPLESDVFLLEFSWNDNGQTRHTTMIALDVIENGSLTRESHLFYLDGDALPPLETDQQMTDLFASFLRVNIADSPYAPGQNIALTTLFDSASENDTVAGTGGDDHIDTGSGDDMILLTDQDATVEGGDGFDTLVLEPDEFGEMVIDYAAGAGLNELHIYDSYNGLYRAEATGIEQITVDSRERVDVEGNAEDNLIGLRQLPSFVEFNGGGGTDVLDLSEMLYQPDYTVPEQALTLDVFLQNFRVTGSATSLTVDDGSGNQFAILNDVEEIRFSDHTVSVAALLSSSAYEDIGADYSTFGNDTISSGSWPVERGEGGDDLIVGSDIDNHFFGNSGADTLDGGEGNDTLIGGGGDDTLWGGEGASDLRDVMYAGEGNDHLDGGYGNDELRGDAGNDTILGGFGEDFIVGGTGDDVMTGQAWSDLMFGGDGDDFINGGFGSDRVNGGAGADRFYHLGIADHGSDWIQDYEAGDGDVLVFGDSTASVDDFQVNFAETANAGIAGIEEAFVIYRPTGQIVWALVDGGDQDEITLRIAGVDYDLLA